MIYLFSATLIWALSFVAGKTAYAMTDPVTVTALRLFIVGAVILPFVLPLLRRPRPRILWAKIWLLGFLTYPVTLLLQFVGLKYTSAASAIAMLGVEPLIVMMIGVIFFRRRIAPLMWFLGFAALVGVILIAGVSNSPDIRFSGCLAVLSASVVVAYWMNLSKSVLGAVKPHEYTLLTIFTGAVSGVPLLFLLNPTPEFRHGFSAWAAVIFLALGCILAAGWCWNKGLKQSSSAAASLILAAEPAFGVVFAALLLGERPDLWAGMGIAMVIAASLTAAVAEHR